MQSRGWRCHLWLSRWHSISWVSTEPVLLPGLGRAIGFVFGFGFSKICSLKICSCKVRKVGHGVWAKFHCCWEYPGSLAFSVRCIFILASFLCTFRQRLSSAQSWLPFSRSWKHPKSFVNLEVRLLKSIFSRQCKHYRARTEVKATNVPHSGAGFECHTDTGMLPRLTSAIHYFLSNWSQSFLSLCTIIGYTASWNSFEKSRFI